jgi:hypothetical protein
LSKVDLEEIDRLVAGSVAMSGRARGDDAGQLMVE